MERTLAILKPDCVRKNLVGKVLAHIQDKGFRIVAMRMVQLTPRTAGGFYAVHKERGFYSDLVAFMSSGPCIPIVLEKENAVTDFRIVIGATDPNDAADGTVRKLYADSKGENIVHGSDSSETAAVEISYFFQGADLLA